MELLLSAGSTAAAVAPPPRRRMWRDLAGVRAWYLAGGMAGIILGAATFLVRPILEMEGVPEIHSMSRHQHREVV